MNTPGGANAKIRLYRRIFDAGGIAELELQEACRARYGLYDPTKGYQARYIDRIRTGAQS